MQGLFMLIMQVVPAIMLLVEALTVKTMTQFYECYFALALLEHLAIFFHS